ncbi:MAG: hypothetical protein JKY84_00810, partial [Emcibacteraceae bacterium]|nr:hypothetical protein [Emcibacteraceae bacterium]
KEGDITLHRFSPTGFYSSAVRNNLLRALEGRTARQVDFRRKAGVDEAFNTEVMVGKKRYFVKEDDRASVLSWIDQGFDTSMRTPDDSLILVSSEEAAEIRLDQKNCMGCLSQCKFSNWSQNPDTNYSTGRGADPRSFCIQKALMNIAHGESLEDNLMFAGHSAFNFASDPFYSNGFVPTVKELMDRIVAGD